jgi:hypothetical protein
MASDLQLNQELAEALSLLKDQARQLQDQIQWMGALADQIATDAKLPEQLRHQVFSAQNPHSPLLTLREMTREIDGLLLRLKEKA